MISVDKTRARLLKNARPCCPVERIPLHLSASRVLAKSITSAISVPPANNSAMDGYAVIASQTTPNTGYTVSQRIPAGQAPEPLKSGTVARIFTGAEIPKNADAVIMQEEARVSSSIDRSVGDDPNASTVYFSTRVTSGENVRKAGQDITQGDNILDKGHSIRPQEIGLLASCGITEVAVYTKLKIAVICTGDELVELGKPLKKGQIYNSNRYLLQALIEKAGFEYIHIDIVADHLEKTKQALGNAADLADVVISCGGVSVGEEDHVKPAVESMGTLDLWKVAIKPGKPLAFGTVRSASDPSKVVDFIGLPGNPSSAFATFLILVLPRLKQRQGQCPLDKSDAISSDQIDILKTETFPAAFHRSPVRRREYLRAKKSLIGGKVQIEIHTNQSSGVLSSACWGDGFAIQREHSKIESGQMIEFISYESLYA